MVPGWGGETVITCLALAGIAAIIWRPHRGQSFKQWWRAFVRAKIISEERGRRRPSRQSRRPIPRRTRAAGSGGRA